MAACLSCPFVLNLRLQQRKTTLIAEATAKSSQKYVEQEYT